MKVLFLTPHPTGTSPSQRFRFEQYFGLLRKNNIYFDNQSFLDHDNWRYFFSPGNTLGKMVAIVKGFAKRFAILLAARKYDLIFIHREASPVGPPVIEWILAKMLGMKIIYDFDDAIWLTDKQNESVLVKLIKYRSKVASICEWSYKVSCGNEYLCQFARTFNKNVVLNPTTIDTTAKHNPREVHSNDHSSTRIVIGWTGSHSTLKYLNDAVAVLQMIQEQMPQVDFVVIADRKPELNLSRLYFKPWKEETEITDLLSFDIGIMPLPDDDWSKGKCGFKALQYMSLEIPAVVSGVGANLSIINNAQDGFLCTAIEEWHSTLIRLITDASLRQRIGSAGREKVVTHYSVLSNGKNFLKLLDIT